MTQTATVPDNLFVILIAPNVSEQMGGEAMKALHIWQQLQKAGVRTHQITHQRVQNELAAKFPGSEVSYVPETRLQSWAWRVLKKQVILDLIFQWRAASMAGELLKRYPRAMVHYTSPVSPILPCFRIPGARVLIGPINGNIYYPAGFRHRESLVDKTRRLTHRFLQFWHKVFFRGKQTATAILVAGGQRTYRSLRWAGCRDEQLVDSLDSGILDRLGELPLAQHTGQNLRFVHNGRLVDHKGTDLVIRALKKTKHPVILEVIGRGPMLPRLRQLADELGLKDRVIFTEWIKDHSKVAEILQQFRAFVFPSLAEANGIVVQEAMMLGLPVIALDWGGPALLVTPECGVLIKPTDEETVATDIAKAMDRLAEDGALAQRMAERGRELAMKRGFLWSDLIQIWMPTYRRVAGG